MLASRCAGLVVPLFSFPSTASWGIGEIGDIATMAAWMEGAGGRVLQILPLNEMAPAQCCPYSALSAMAIDPIFIHVPAVSDWTASPSDGANRRRLEEARLASRIDYGKVRELKRQALGAAFERFHSAEWCRDTDRALAFRAYRASQAWWIDEHALFRALHAREDDRSWVEWPEPLRRRDPAALADARRELSREILFHQYLQWLADLQWQRARSTAASSGVALFGDLPFMVDTDSADVWARQEQFNFDVSVGAPPDEFSVHGQDWGLPACRWDVMAADNFQWLRDRARRAAYLYDGYRVDHLVGFYRTYVRPRDGREPYFSPATESEQVTLGERVLDVLTAAGARVIVEDLGTVPDSVRASLARRQVPGFRVLRWERHWSVEGQPFRDPAEYPPQSVAASGTHDTEPLLTWWTRASSAERQAVSELPTVQRLTSHADLAQAPFNPTVRDVLVEALFASSSLLVLNVFQDVFGWPDRINDPSTTDGHNWTFRLPWPVDRLADAPEARERQARLAEWSQQHQR